MMILIVTESSLSNEKQIYNKIFRIKFSYSLRLPHKARSFSIDTDPKKRSHKKRVIITESQKIM